MKGFTLCSFVLARWNIGRMKRRPSTAAEVEPAQKRSVTYETFKNWRTDLDRDHHTVSWLDGDTVSEGGKKVVQRLKCLVCSKFKASIRGRRNFNDRWIVGADSVRTSIDIRIEYLWYQPNVKDHAESDQHTHAMQLLKKEQGIAAGLGAASLPLLRRHCQNYQQKSEIG